MIPAIAEMTRLHEVVPDPEGGHEEGGESFGAILGAEVSQVPGGLLREGTCCHETGKFSMPFSGTRGPCADAGSKPEPAALGDALGIVFPAAVPASPVQAAAPSEAPRPACDAESTHGAERDGSQEDGFIQWRGTDQAIPCPAMSPGVAALADLGPVIAAESGAGEVAHRNALLFDRQRVPSSGCDLRATAALPTPCQESSDSQPCAIGDWAEHDEETLNSGQFAPENGMRSETFRTAEPPAGIDPPPARLLGHTSGLAADSDRPTPDGAAGWISPILAGRTSLSVQGGQRGGWMENGDDPATFGPGPTSGGMAMGGAPDSRALEWTAWEADNEEVPPIEDRGEPAPRAAVSGREALDERPTPLPVGPAAGRDRIPAPEWRMRPEMSAPPLHPASFPRLAAGIRLASTERGMSMRLRLHPEALGDVQIQVRWEEGKVHARLEVLTPGAWEALEGGLPQLRATLAEQGVPVDGLQVDLREDQFGRTADRRGRSDRDGQAAGGREPRKSDAAGEEAPRTGRLDLSA